MINFHEFLMVSKVRKFRFELIGLSRGWWIKLTMVFLVYLVQTGEFKIKIRHRYKKRQIKVILRKVIMIFRVSEPKLFFNNLQVNIDG